MAIQEQLERLKQKVEAWLTSDRKGKLRAFALS